RPPAKLPDRRSDAAVLAVLAVASGTQDRTPAGLPSPSPPAPTARGTPNTSESCRTAGIRTPAAQRNPQPSRQGSPKRRLRRRDDDLRRGALDHECVDWWITGRAPLKPPDGNANRWQRQPMATPTRNRGRTGHLIDRCRLIGRHAPRLFNQASRLKFRFRPPHAKFQNPYLAPHPGKPPQISLQATTRDTAHPHTPMLAYHLTTT